mgnify:CR=1 FL=1
MKLFFLLTIPLLLFNVHAQEMTPDRLHSVIQRNADEVKRKANQWQFTIDDQVLICIADPNADRMRIIAPIAKVEQLTDTQLKNALVANFHTALDVKYAVSDNLIWSVYLHPLQALSESQLDGAILQTYRAAITFGDTYQSTDMVFPGSQRKQNQKKKKEKQPIPLKQG